MIYIVSALHPRSGTTAMMMCLEAAGIPVVQSEERNKKLQKVNDNEYNAQKNNFYEIKFDEYFKVNFPLQYKGKAIKIFYQGLTFIAAHEYRIIFMKRDIEETRQSTKYGIRHNPDKYILENYEGLLNHTVGIMKQRKDVLSIDVVDYYDLITYTEEVINKLTWLDNKAVNAIDKNMYRFKKENLVVTA